MPIQSIVKSKEYDGVRLTLVGSMSSTQYYHYAEALGTRHYINEIGSTAGQDLDAASFNTYMSFTSSGTETWDFTLIPMSTGETVMIETNISGLNSDGSKGFTSHIFGSYRHSGSALTTIGPSLDYFIKNDFTTAVHASFSAHGTSSINLKIYGDSGQVIDWDLHIKYTKGFHPLTTGGGGGSNPPVIYPPPSNPTA